MQENSFAGMTYSNYLYQVLMDYGKVSLAGLGTLILDRKSAYFNSSRTNIFPPCTSLRLEQNAYSISDFANKLKSSGLGEKLASSIEADVIKLIQNNDNFFQLLPWARIDNGNLVVDHEEKFNAFEGLETLPIQVLTHAVERHYVHEIKMDHEPIQIKQTVPYKDGWQDYLVPLFIALSFAIGIFFWYKTYKSSQAQQYTQTIKYAPKPERVNNSSPIENKTDKEAPILDPSETTDNKSIEPKSTDSLPKPGKEQLNDVQKSPDPANLDPSTSDGCIIIVGAFKDDNNANKLMQKLVNEGYKPYVGSVNGLKRVGISFDCEKRNPDSFKNVIKSTIAKDAWQLKETL